MGDLLCHRGRAEFHVHPIEFRGHVLYILLVGNHGNGVIEQIAQIVVFAVGIQGNYATEQETEAVFQLLRLRHGQLPRQAQRHCVKGWLVDSFYLRATRRSHSRLERFDALRLDSKDLDCTPSSNHDAGSLSHDSHLLPFWRVEICSLLVARRVEELMVPRRMDRDTRLLTSS